MKNCFHCKEALNALWPDHLCHTWNHANLHKALIDRTKLINQPTAALLADLDQRGLLYERWTL